MRQSNNLCHDALTDIRLNNLIKILKSIINFVKIH
ncbi:MAG: hypothetical protein BWY64_04054 [bacterium ADurb.Bin363]|nr:MAG: hypothetical protein BWY64_04054 [bacterium ADurb.Bin363]